MVRTVRSINLHLYDMLHIKCHMEPLFVKTAVYPYQSCDFNELLEVFDKRKNINSGLVFDDRGDHIYLLLALC